MSGAFDRERARPHALLGVGSLASMPLERGRGLDSVEVLRGTVEGVELAVHRPCLTRLGRPSGKSPAFLELPELAPHAHAHPNSPPVAFEFDGATLRAQIAFGAGTTFCGAGQAAGPLVKNGRMQVFWNSDAFRYGEESPSLYSSHPCALALCADGSAAFVVADSVRRGTIAFASDGIELAFEEEPFDLLLLHAPSPADAVRAFTRISGRMQLPPAWALGYHQCRWSYASQDEVLAVAREFRERAIPCAAIWLDIDHMDRLRSFSWNPETFPDPRGMLAELRALGMRCVAIVDPGLAADPSYSPTARALAEGHFVLDARSGAPAAGRVWPGLCHFPDFTREATRRYWGELAGEFASIGIDGLWCDMNEPALFRTPGKTLAESARHRGLGGGSHARFHNLYGHLMARATHEGLLRARPEVRPFVLTRSSHLATARFAATWTGDNQASWKDLRWSLAMVLGLGLSGQPFAGPDIGGFDGDPDAELFVRWFELGAWLPFARGHGEKSSRRKEPWAFGPEAEAHVRRALERRAALAPQLYTLFEEAARTGLPVARPMFFADPRLRAVEDQFLLGRDLCVAPVLAPGQSERAVVLPAGGWYAFSDRDEHGGGELVTATEVRAAAPLGTTPVFARAGSIVTLARSALPGGKVARSALGSEPLALHVFLDERGAASGELYEDDGESLAYRRGRFARRRFRARWNGSELALEVEREGDGHAPSPFAITVHGVAGGTRTINP